MLRKLRFLMTDDKRAEEISPAIVGLTIADGKALLASLQEQIVTAQIQQHVANIKPCPRCGKAFRTKGYSGPSLTRPSWISRRDHPTTLHALHFFLHLAWAARLTDQVACLNRLGVGALLLTWDNWRLGEL